MNFLVVNRNFNDIDHLTPICYQLLKSGHNINIIIVNEYINYEDDYRLKFLREKGALIHSILDFSRFKAVKFFFNLLKKIYNRSSYSYLLKKYSFSIMEKVAKRVDFNIDLFVNERKIDAVLFDWCDPLNSTNAIKTLYLYTQKNNILTFSLPHGMDIHVYAEVNNFLVQNKKKISKNNPLNNFNYVVTNNEQHENTLLYNGVDKEILFNLGSARFSKQWMDINSKLLNTEYIAKTRKKEILVFMPQHSQYGVDIEKQVNLIKSISSLEKYILYFKPHTRNQNEKYFHEVSKIKNVIMANNILSIPLIEIADAVIVYGSSIVLEATFKRKLVLYPKFLHDGETLFEKTSACELFKTESNLINYLKRGLIKNYSFKEEENFIQVASNQNNSDNILGNYEDFLVRKVKEQNGK